MSTRAQALRASSPRPQQDSASSAQYKTMFKPTRGKLVVSKLLRILGYRIGVGMHVGLAVTVEVGRGKSKRGCWEQVPDYAVDEIRSQHRSETLLWVILHHFETMENHCLLVYTGGDHHSRVSYVVQSGFRNHPQYVSNGQVL